MQLMDDKDLEIVKLLQHDAWQTYAVIGEQVHLSPSAVQRRIDRLKERGIITGAKATINQHKTGNKLRVYMVLELHHDNAEHLDALTNDLNQHAIVTSVDAVMGKFDIVVTIDCRDSEELTEFAMGVLNKNPNISHFWTLTSIKKLI